MPALCPKPLKSCAMRLTLLDECGVPVDTQAVPNSQIAFKDFVSLEFSPNVETGDEFTLRNACGELCINEKDCDEITRLDFTLQLCGLQPHVEQLLGASNSLINADGTIIGAAGGGSRSSGANCGTNTMLEVWTNNAAVKACTDDTACPYIRWIFPWTTNWTVSGTSSFTNDIIGLELTGIGQANGSFDSPIGLTDDPDITQEMIDAVVLNEEKYLWVCTDVLPDLVECDFANAG